MPNMENSDWEVTSILCETEANCKFQQYCEHFTTAAQSNNFLTYD